MLPDQIRLVSAPTFNQNKTSPERGRTGDNDELSLSGAEGLEGRLISEHIFTRFHNKRKARVNGIGGLLGLLGRGCVFSQTLTFLTQFNSTSRATYPSLHFWYSGLNLGEGIGYLVVVLLVNIGREISRKHTESPRCVGQVTV